MREVAVFFGGKSCEREISVLTGVFVLNVLNGEKYRPFPVFIAPDGAFYTSPKMFDLSVFKRGRYEGFRRIFFDGGQAYLWTKTGKKSKPLGKIDAALNCCHGGLGEGGGVSALLAMQGIPSASPDLTASGVFLDKTLTKLIAKGLGVPVVDWVRVSEKDYQKRGKFLLKTVGLRLKYPVVVKPARQGSSIGVTLAKNEEELKKGLDEAFALDTLALVEKYVQGKKDVNCAAYLLDGEIVLSETEIANGSDGVYTFSKKYTDENAGGFLKGGGRETLNGKLREKIRTYTKLIYRRMNLQGVVRMDFLVGEADDLYLSEVNAVPGSLAYYLFCERISDAREFFGDLIEEGILRFRREKKQTFDTGVLAAALPRK